MIIYYRIKLFSLFCVVIHGDVSSLKTFSFGRNHEQRKAFNGYYYNPPTTSLPTTTTFLPEIIINKGNKLKLNEK